MGYCRCCGHWAALDDAAMCARCRRDWQPAGSAPADLGCHTQARPLGTRNGGSQWGNSPLAKPPLAA